MRIVIIVLISTLILVVLVPVLVLGRSDWRLLFTFQDTVRSSGEDRVYRLYNSSDQEEKPLVIALHGLGDRPTWLAAYSGLHLLADEEDYTLALPSGKNNSWNADFCCGRSFVSGVEDTQFILDMIDDIFEDHNINSDNIYVVGFSNGGALAQKLLHEAPSTFAGGAAVMSGVGSNSDKLDISSAQTPIMLLNGDDDRYVPIKDRHEGEEFSFLPAKETGQMWASQLDAGTLSIDEGEEYDSYRWGNGELLQQRIYHNQRHRWPQWRMPTFSSQVPDSTQAIWQFWQNSS